MIAISGYTYLKILYIEHDINPEIDLQQEYWAHCKFLCKLENWAINTILMRCPWAYICAKITHVHKHNSITGI